MWFNQLFYLWLLSAFTVVQCVRLNDNSLIEDNISQLDNIDNFAAPTNHAKVARDLVHQSDWASFGTVSTIETVLGYPMVSITSVADSPRGGKSTGNIYFFVARESLKYKDLVKLNEATLLFSEAQNGTCQKRSVDPMEPTCMRTMISGLVYRLENGTSNYDFGRSAFISRHPAAHNWLEEHNMVLCELEIKQILVIDFYGGANNVSVKDYYSYKSESSSPIQTQLRNSQDEFPIPTNHAKVARKLVHAANWTSIGTISIMNKIRGYPMVSVSSVADSRSGYPSTGNIYFYLAKESLKYKDLIVKNQASMLFSEAHTMRCQQRGTDPMEPTCKRAMLSGKVIQIKNGTAEFDFARAAFVDRHPVSVNWLEIHGMILCQLKIEHILVIDFYGGAKEVSVNDYYKVKGEHDEEQRARTQLDIDLIDNGNELISNVDKEVNSNYEFKNNLVHIRIHKSDNETDIDIYV